MYGNLVGYEPADTPGAYRFETKDGRKLLAFGPEAEAMRKRLDQAKAIGPQRTADASESLASTPSDLATDAPTASMSEGPLMSQAPEPMTAAGNASLNPDAAPPGGMSVAPEQLMSTQPRSVMSPNPGPAPAAPQQEGPQYVGVAQNKDGSIVQMRVGADPNNPQPGDLRVFRPGSRGSKGGLALRSQSVQGGYDVDPEFMGEQAYLHGGERLGQQLGVDAADAQAANEHAYNQRMLENRANAESEARAHSDAVMGRVQELDNRYTQLEKEFTGARVDPRRALAGGKNWIAAFAAGIGSVGASLGKHPNYAMQIIEQRIADDIRAQETEIAVKRDSADNAYKRLLQETGSSELAKKALEGIQLQKLRAEFEVQAKPGGDKARQAQAVAMLVELDKRYSLWRQGYRQAAHGEVSKQFVNMPGSAGHAAGYVLPTMDQIQGTKGALAPQNLPKEGEGAPGGKKSAQQANYEQSVKAAWNSLNDAVSAAGGSINPVTGEITGDLDLPIDLPGGDSEATANVKAKFTAFGNVYANTLNNGAEAGQPTKEKLTPGLGITDNPQGVAKAAARELALRLQQIEAGNQ